MDPDWTAPTGAVGSGSVLFAKKDSKAFQQTTKQTKFMQKERRVKRYHFLGLLG